MPTRWTMNLREHRRTSLHHIVDIEECISKGSAWFVDPSVEELDRSAVEHRRPIAMNTVEDIEEENNHLAYWENVSCPKQNIPRHEHSLRTAIERTYEFILFKHAISIGGHNKWIHWFTRENLFQILIHGCGTPIIPTFVHMGEEIAPHQLRCPIMFADRIVHAPHRGHLSHSRVQSTECCYGGVIQSDSILWIDCRRRQASAWGNENGRRLSNPVRSCWQVTRFCHDKGMRTRLSGEERNRQISPCHRWWGNNGCLLTESLEV